MAKPKYGTSGNTSKILKTKGGKEITKPIADYVGVYQDNDGYYNVLNNPEYTSKSDILADIKGNGYASRGTYTKNEIETILETQFFSDLPYALSRKSDRTLTVIQDYFLY